MIIIAGKNKSLSRRYFANVVDYILVCIVLFLYIVWAGAPNDSGGFTVRGFKALVIPLAWFLYFPLCECLFKQTPGKKVFDLYVVDFKGEGPTIVQAFLRRLADPLEIVFAGMPAMICINHSQKGQRMGDMMAGTLVVSTDVICRFCNSELELNCREVVQNVFRCPTCNNINQ